MSNPPDTSYITYRIYPRLLGSREEYHLVSSDGSRSPITREDACALLNSGTSFLKYQHGRLDSEGRLQWDDAPIPPRLTVPIGVKVPE